MNNDKNTYYEHITTEIFLGGKELLKSMPAFYNKIYFSSKYANALWSGDKEETFPCVTILSEEVNMPILRQIIKNNFLYIGNWDSLKFMDTDEDDYGFSFIGGHIKYILMPFEETETGYRIKSYDVSTGNCSITEIESDKKFFLDVSIKENGEIIRTCDFNLENMNEENTKTHRAPKKAQPELVAISGNRGSAISNTLILLLVGVLSVATVYISYLVISG